MGAAIVKDGCKNISSSKRDNDHGLKELREKLYKNPELIDYEMRALCDSSISNYELPKEQEMEALLSEMNALKSKSAMRRSFENKRTSEEIVHLYEENCKLSAKIDALNESIDKRSIQNVRLKEENDRYKCEKKRLESLLKAQISRKMVGDLYPKKIAFVKKITTLERQNIELLTKYQDVLNVLKMERENYAQFLKFIFLKILVFKCFALSRNKIFSNDSMILENDENGDELPMDTKNLFLLRLCKSSFNEEKPMRITEKKSVTLRNESFEIVENYCSGQRFIRNTCDASILCKLENRKNRVSSGSNLETNVKKSFENKIYKTNRKLDSHYNAVSSGDCKPSSNFQKIILLIRLYKERFHDEFKKKNDSKVDKTLKTNSHPSAFKPRCKTGIPVRKNNYMSPSNKQILRTVDWKKNERQQSRNNKTQQIKIISKIENSECDKKGKLEAIVEKSIPSPNQESRMKIYDINYLEFYILANYIYRNMSFVIRLDQVFSKKFQDPLIVKNSAYVKSLEFISRRKKFHVNENEIKNMTVFSERGLIIEELDSKLEKDNEMKKLDSKINEKDIEILKEDSIVKELDSVIGKPNSKVERNTRQIIKKCSSASPIAFSPFFNRSRKIGKRNEEQVSETRYSKLKTDKRDVKIVESKSKIEKNIVIKQTKMENEINKQSNTIWSQRKISKSLSADRTRFSPTFQKLKKENRRSRKQESKMENSPLEIQEKNTKVEELNPIIKEQDLEIEKKISKVVQSGLNIKQVNLKVEKKCLENVKQDYIIEKQCMEIKDQNLEIKKHCFKTEEENPQVPGQDSNIKKTLDLIIERQDSKIDNQHLQYNKEDLKIEGKNLEHEKQHPETKIQLESRMSKVSTQDMRIEKVKEKQLNKTLELKRANGSLSMNRTPFSLTAQTLKKTPEKYHENEIVFISKIPKGSKNKTKKGKVVKEFNISSSRKRINNSFSESQSQILSIQKSSKDKSSNSKTEKKPKNSTSQKKNSQIKTSNPSQVLIKKKQSKRIQTSEVKIQKIKSTRKVKSSSKNFKSTCRITCSNLSSREVRPKSKDELKMKKEDSSKTEKRERRKGEEEKEEEEKGKKKLKPGIKTGPLLDSIRVGSASSKIQNRKLTKELIDESTETNRKVDVCVSTKDSALKRVVVNKNLKVISNTSSECISEVVRRISSKSISIEGKENVATSRISLEEIVSESKKADITSDISDSTSRSRKSNGGKGGENKGGRSKECDKKVYKVIDCIERSTKESSVEGDEKFIGGIEPSIESESSKRTSDCGAVWEDFGFRKFSEMSSQDSDSGRNMNEKQRISVWNKDAIEGTEYTLTLSTENGPGIIKKDEILSKNQEQDRKWTDEIMKIEAWNIRVRDYLKEVRVKLLENEKALEEGRIRLRHRKYSLGDLKVLTSQNI